MILGREARTKIAVKLILLGMAISVLHYIVLNVEGFHDQIYDFLASPVGRFDDFFLNYRAVVTHNPYATNASQLSQFPFLYAIASLMTVFSEKTAVVIFILIFICFYFGYGIANLKSKNKLQTSFYVIVFSIFTYPFLFALQRANYEILIFILLAIFATLFRTNKRAFASVALTCAIAVKPFPAVFILLYVIEKKYKEAALILIGAIAITLASYEYIGGGLHANLIRHLANLELYNRDYVIGSAGLAFGHSLFGMIKTTFAIFAPVSFTTSVKLLYTAYPYVIVSLMILTMIYLITNKLEYWVQVTFMVLIMNLFPFVSADYKLIHFLIPFYLFLNKLGITKYDYVYILLFVLLLIPKSYYYFQFNPNVQIVPFSVSSSVILNPIVMLLLFMSLFFAGPNNAENKI
jgi:hypothetical protein